MLAQGQRLAQRGVDAVVGLAETHSRTDTKAMLTTIEQIPPVRLGYRGSTFDELDVDKVLSRRQELLHGSVINKAIRTAGPVEVHVIPARHPVNYRRSG